METITTQAVTSIVGPKQDKSQQQQEEDLLTDVRELLAELFLFWYGKTTSKKILKQSFNRKGRMILCTSTTTRTIPNDKDIPVCETEECWQNKWFAVDSEQQSTSHLFLQKCFGSLLDHDTLKYECVTNLQPDSLWETLALIVLFDQVSRIIYRGTPKAYQTDHKALHYALELVDSGMVLQLPLHFQSTVLICLCHAKDPAVHEVCSQLLRRRAFDVYLLTHERIANALKLMHRDSLETVDLFGQFPPDGNRVILSRQSTADEEVFLSTDMDVVEEDAAVLKNRETRTK